MSKQSGGIAQLGDPDLVFLANQLHIYLLGGGVLCTGIDRNQFVHRWHFIWLY